LFGGRANLKESLTFSAINKPQEFDPAEAQVNQPAEHFPR
jgi:hypothetical protein